MPTRAIVSGQIEKHGGVFIDLVLNRTCNSLKEILEAVEQAFDKDATTIIIKRIMPVGRKR